MYVLLSDDYPCDLSWIKSHNSEVQTQNNDYCQVLGKLL